MSKAEFFWHCAKLGLTLEETQTAEKICSALLLYKYADLIRELKVKPHLLEYIRALTE